MLLNNLENLLVLIILIMWILVNMFCLIFPLKSPIHSLTFFIFITLIKVSRDCPFTPHITWPCCYLTVKLTSSWYLYICSYICSNRRLIRGDFNGSTKRHRNLIVLMLGFCTFCYSRSAWTKIMLNLECFVK